MREIQAIKTAKIIESRDFMRFYMPTKVYSEVDCVDKHSKEIAALGTKALIVTGRNSSRINGSLDDVIAALNKENVPYVLFDQIEENPSIETVMKATAVGLENAVDFVIGLGGGSPMDASKAIAMMIANPDLDESVLYKSVELKHLPVVAIPTTAGTGSEVTPWAILTVHSERTKKSMSHQVFPALALMDCKYLKAMSRNILVSTAVDTLAHLTESYLVKKADGYSRIFSEKGLTLWGKFKDALLNDTMSDEDYELMFEACTMGGIAIAHTGTGFPHALSYMMTYETGAAHGVACGYTLGGFVKYYEDAKLQKEVLDALGFENADDFCAYLDALIHKPILPEGLWEADVADIANNPKRVASYPFAIDQETMLKYLA